MDSTKKIFSDFIRQKIKEKQKRSIGNGVPNLLNINVESTECNQIYNGCLTRVKLIEIRLNDILCLQCLPCFEDIVQHLRTCRKNQTEDSCFGGRLRLGFRDTHKMFNGTDLGVSIVLNKSSNYKDDDEAFPIKNVEYLLKELLSHVSKFIQIDNHSGHETIIEGATTYLLWIFYDMFHSDFESIPGLPQLPSTSNWNFVQIGPYCSTLEYTFCLETLNIDLIEKMAFCSRSLFELMEPKYLGQIFFYSSIIKDAINDVEKSQESSKYSDWFKTFVEDSRVLNKVIDPFNMADLNYKLITDDDQRLINEVQQDVSKFNFEYSNAEFILQSLFYSSNSKVNISNSIKNFSAPILINNVNELTSNHQSEKSTLLTEMDNEQSIEDVLSNLYADLSTFINDYNTKHKTVYYLNLEELYNTVLNWLINNENIDSLSEELTNLLGENSVQLITKFVTIYQPKVRNSNANISDGEKQPRPLEKKKKNTETAEQLWQMIQKTKDTGSSMVRPSVVIHTAKEKALKKEMRKIIKMQKFKMYKSDANETNQTKLSLQDLEKMRERNLKASIRIAIKMQQETELKKYQPIEKYPFVYDLYQTIKTSASYIAETKLLLPIGTERKDFKTHEEVIIPIITTNEETTNFLKNFQQIDISDTDEFIKTAFKGFSKLNIIQSAVFQTAYLSNNQNMLICAPTGAGKTNIAMLTILNILRTFSTDDTINNIELDQFKIIYIAPMKALCAEMTATLSKRLSPFCVKVRELTGDMQMTSKEIMETQMLVVTPEKWDVITRKSVGDVQLMDLVRLIVIDEVHLLQSDRGHVLETIVARTVRHVEQTQKYIRMIGLSATLPNYVDVAHFLHVDLYKGLFVFDDRFRPVPLLKTFIGCKASNKTQMNIDMDEITFNKVKEILINEHQVMIFVHSRNATMMMANYLLERSQKTDLHGESVNYLFTADTTKLHGSDKLIARARYRNLNKFLLNGIGIHHAGMPRSERNVVEKLFGHGVIKVLVCTSTLAWGVNLPAHSVIIRGTEYYDPSQGHFVDIDMLDVMQIFGRAGRPQFDTDGEATIITTHGQLSHYLSLLTNKLPIESRFLKCLTDNLNAEIVLGTVSNIREAVEWLKYTYLYIRMQKNPLEYGLKTSATMDRTIILDHLTVLARTSAEQLDRAQMIRYDPEREGTLDATHLGRIASHFYICHESIVHFNENLKITDDVGHLLELLSKSSEFQQLRCRDEEIVHLEMLRKACLFVTTGDLSNTHTKVKVLLQAAVGRLTTECHSLNSDLMYILQNVSRLTRGLFEYVLKRGWPNLVQNFWKISLMFEKKIWDFDTPLYQFENELAYDVLKKLSNLHIQNRICLYRLKEMDPKEIGQIIHDKRYGSVVKRLAQTIPNVLIEASVKPITRTILTIYVDVMPDFIWDDKYHGKTGQIYWIWLTDMDNNHIYHAELGRLTKKQVVKQESQHFVFTIALLDASHLQKQYMINSMFEYWMGSDNSTVVSCDNIILPEKYLPNTPLLDLMPLPIKALKNKLFESIYPFTHFNPIQTQIFHTLYHTDHNVLLGAPTGSGKTIAAEIALFRVIRTKPQAKIVYIAPLKALVRERVDDWKKKIENKIGLQVVELTGDVTPDLATIDSANIIVTTPEKWDGVSRGWTFRKFVRQVALIIIDEIHLLGEERGPVLEVIVSRTNFICRRTGENIRIIGLSTAVANAHDLSTWLNIEKSGLYNFSSSVRPVPIEVHVSGFPGKHYCPRMASMNKPTYRAIKQHSPNKPVIVFVSSRRQTRLTSLDLITLIASDDHSVGLPFLHIDDPDDLETLLDNVKDSYLKHTLRFGIGMHHAGLIESDRKLVEQLFLRQQIQVLITTATLAWGINLPAHAVIIKGTEFFDGKKGRYVDFPITDVLQMIGRAGRPQYDNSAVAILFVHDIKKEYYRKFLYEPFPVESHLLEVFADHLNAEIMAGTVKTKHEAMEYLSSTYLYHRIIKNPSYYGVDLSELGDRLNDELVINTQVIKFLSSYIDKCVQILLDNYCIRLINQDNEDDQEEQYDQVSEYYSVVLNPTPLGKIASFYYLSYKTIRLFQDKLCPIEDDSGYMGFTYLKTNEILDLLTMATEYATLPVRHNEELLNQQLAQSCPIKIDRRSMDSPHTKANLLLQAHCGRLQLPIVDYYTDLKTVLDQVIRILQAMVDISAMNGSLPTTINIINLQQSIMQASWQHSNQLLIFMQTSSARHSETYFDDDLNGASEYYASRQNQLDSAIADLQQLPPELCSIPALLHFIRDNNNKEIAFKNLLQAYSIPERIITRIYKSLLNLPVINLEKIAIKKLDAENFNSAVNVSLENTFKSLNEMDWIQLEADTDYLICCQMRRIFLHSNRSSNKCKAHCPNFPKPKSESWYMILGVQEDAELITITRVPHINNYSTQVNIKFRTPTNGQPLFYTLYLLSDCYIGIDQQYTIPISF